MRHRCIKVSLDKDKYSTLSPEYFSSRRWEPILKVDGAWFISHTSTVSPKELRYSIWNLGLTSVSELWHGLWKRWFFGCVTVGVAFVRREYHARGIDCMSCWSQTSMLLLFFDRGRIQFEGAQLLLVLLLLPFISHAPCYKRGFAWDVDGISSHRFCRKDALSSSGWIAATLTVRAYPWCQRRSWVRECVLSDAIHVQMITSAVRNPVDTWCKAMNVCWFLYCLFNDDVSDYLRERLHFMQLVRWSTIQRYVWTVLTGTKSIC